MARENIILGGFNIPDNRKWYCNQMDDSVARCCDLYNENGNLVQYIGWYILTGDEEWKYNPVSKCYYFYMNDKYYDEVDGGQYDPMLCTHFRWSNDIESTPLYMFAGGKQNEIQFNYDNGEGGVDNFVAWIKDRQKTKIPVEICFVLKYPRYFQFNSHKRTIIQNMNGLRESIKQLKK